MITMLITPHGRAFERNVGNADIIKLYASPRELPHHLIREQAHRRLHLVAGHAAEGEVATEVFDAARLQCFYLGVGGE